MMDIKGKKVLIHGEDVTSSIKSIYEVFSGYQVHYLNKAISSFNTAEVGIVDAKPFDISEHEFSDNDISVLILKERALYLSIEFGSERDNAIAVIDKQDAMAIAKALGVTGEDLK